MASVPPNRLSVHRGPASRAFVLDERAVVTEWLYERVRSGGMSQDEADRAIKAYESGAKSFVPAVKDIAGSGRLAFRLAKDMKSWRGRVYFRSYDGKEYVIIKGRPGQRTILTGTRYRTSNAKIVELQIGRPGLRAAARESAVFGIVLVTAIDVTDYLVRDSATLGELFGTVSIDIAKVLIASGIGYAAGALAAGTLVVGTFALGPLVMAVAMGVVAGIALDKLDEHFGVTERLCQALDHAIDKFEAVRRRLLREASDRLRDLERARYLIDLSREAYEIYQKIGRQLDPPRWQLRPF